MSSQHIATQWFAIRTRRALHARDIFAAFCDEVYVPTETVSRPGYKPRLRAVIPNVLFVKTTREAILAREADLRHRLDAGLRFWIYRYPDDNEIQVIPQQSIDLLRLLTADDTSRCRIYNPAQFTVSQRVRVTAGPFSGYTGYVKRIEKNKHVVVSIEGLCMVILPYIHPDLLEPVPDSDPVPLSTPNP